MCVLTEPWPSYCVSTMPIDVCFAILLENACIIDRTLDTPIGVNNDKIFPKPIGLQKVCFMSYRPGCDYYKYVYINLSPRALRGTNLHTPKASLFVPVVPLIAPPELFPRVQSGGTSFKCHTFRACMLCKSMCKAFVTLDSPLSPCSYTTTQHIGHSAAAAIAWCFETTPPPSVHPSSGIMSLT